MNYSESSSSNSSKASTSQDNSHLFCEPGPSRSNRQQPQQPQSQPQNQQQPPPINGGGGQSSSSGNNNNRNPNRNSEVLEYDLDALDNFPDPSPGDFDPSNSLSSSFPPIMDSHPGNFESQYLLICITICIMQRVSCNRFLGCTHAPRTTRFRCARTRVRTSNFKWSHLAPAPAH